jgi:hypothetical protein
MTVHRVGGWFLTHHVPGFAQTTHNLPRMPRMSAFRITNAEPLPWTPFLVGTPWSIGGAVEPDYSLVLLLLLLLHVCEFA